MSNNDKESKLKKEIEEKDIKCDTLLQLNIIFRYEDLLIKLKKIQEEKVLELIHISELFHRKKIQIEEKYNLMIKEINCQLDITNEVIKDISPETIESVETNRKTIEEEMREVEKTYREESNKNKS